MNSYLKVLSEENYREVEKALLDEHQEYVDENILSLQQTEIIKFKLDDLDYSGKGLVPGAVQSQYWMDQEKTHFRVASTFSYTPYFPINRTSDYYDVVLERTPVDPGSVDENYVTVFNQFMTETGQVGGLGIDESIYSARFNGDQAYVVTFRQIDPFYIIDLSDSTNPRVTGELKIPGYSDYLHNLTDDLVLGIGREDSSAKIALFDVNNPKRPIEVSRFLISDYLENSYDPTSFVHNRDQKYFFMPGSEFSYIFSYKTGQLELEKTIKASSYTSIKATYTDQLLYVFNGNEMIIYNTADWNEVKRVELVESEEVKLEPDSPVKEVDLSTETDPVAE